MTPDFVNQYGKGTRLVRRGNYFFVRIKNKQDSPHYQNRYFIGSTQQVDRFYDDIKQELGATDQEMTLLYLGSKLFHYSKPREAYQVIPSVYELLSESQQNQCELNLDDDWHGPDE